MFHSVLGAAETLLVFINATPKIELNNKHMAKIIEGINRLLLIVSSLGKV
jgi:hypothetical protein